MHAKPGLRVVLEWKIYRPDSVIAAVIPLNLLQPTFAYGISKLSIVLSFFPDVDGLSIRNNVLAA